MRPKIDFKTAEIIRQRYNEGVPGKTLAYDFGVTKATISYIVNNRCWLSKDWKGRKETIQTRLERLEAALHFIVDASKGCANDVSPIGALHRRACAALAGEEQEQ